MILTKIAVKELFETVFEYFLAFLEAEIHRFVIFHLAWKTLYKMIGLPLHLRV